MTRYRKLKKVSWAPEGKLCQIRHFMPEDCPSEVGLGVDHRMQLKPSRRQQINFSSKKHSPGLCRPNLVRSEKSISIPTTRWKRPAKINLDPNWLVASGEKSMEVDVQNQRELKVFQAVYPYPPDIPPSPSGALCKDGYLPDDCSTSVIRITPIEDDKAPSYSSSELVPSPSGASPQLPVVSASQPSGILNSTQCIDADQTPNFGVNQGMYTCAEADVAAAASAAVTALVKSGETGSSIDTNILIKILNNPETISMLLNMPFSASLASGKCNGAPKATQCSPTTLQPRYLTDSSPNGEMPPSCIGGPIIKELPSRTTVKQVKPHFNSASVTLSTIKEGPPPQVKDANYYKNLIKKHGLDDQDFQLKHNIRPQQQNVPGSTSPDDGITKNSRRLGRISKSCIYFNTPKGCRKGSECPFQHDITSMQAGHVTEIANSKRMTLGRVLTSKS